MTTETLTPHRVITASRPRRRCRPRDARNPFGYGRDAYFWALIASVVVFVTGAVFSLREGITELLHPVAGSTFLAVYVVLAISLALDGISLTQSSRQLRSEALGLHRDFLDQLALTSDPTLRAVFAEDAAAIAGDLIALASISMHHLLGSSTPEGFAAVLIGLLLVGVGAQLARRNHDFLLGEQASPVTHGLVRAVLVGFPDVVAVHELLVSFVGPRQLWVLARVAISNDLGSVDLQALIRTIETTIEGSSRYIIRVDITPVGMLQQDQPVATPKS